MDSLVVEALADKLKDPNFNVREDDEGDNSSKADVEVKEGTVAVFENVESLGEEFLGVAISESKVQPYKCSTSGFVPDGVSLCAKGLKVIKNIKTSEYYYVSKGFVMFLKLKV